MRLLWLLTLALIVPDPGTIRSRARNRVLISAPVPVTAVWRIAAAPFRRDFPFGRTPCTRGDLPVEAAFLPGNQKTFLLQFNECLLKLVIADPQGVTGFAMRQGYRTIVDAVVTFPDQQQQGSRFAGQRLPGRASGDAAMQPNERL
ncbi:MAG: hypothetical protein P1U65_11200 [Minwuia sp.]|nr:hypothetical protein [Minwuia sp.]